MAQVEATQCVGGRQAIGSLDTNTNQFTPIVATIDGNNLAVNGTVRKLTITIREVDAADGAVSIGRGYYGLSGALVVPTGTVPAATDFGRAGDALNVPVGYSFAFSNSKIPIVNDIILEANGNAYWILTCEGTEHVVAGDFSALDFNDDFYLN